MLRGWMRMLENRTAVGYFMAIISVVGGVWLIPSLPVFVLMSGPLVLLGLCIFWLGRKVIRIRQQRVQRLATEQITQALPAQDATAEEQVVAVKELETVSVF